MAFFNSLKAMVRKPFFYQATLFPTAYSLSWIPSISMVFDTIELIEGQEPDGDRTEFTFAQLPRFILLNGQWMYEGIGFIRSGNTVTFIDQSGTPYAPGEFSQIRGVA